MINVLPESQSETTGLFEQSDIGLYEINDAGTVLYGRISAEKTASRKILGSCRT